MKFLKAITFLCLMAFVTALLMQRQYLQAYVVSFAGFAILADWSQGLSATFRQNIIADDLQITRILDNAIIGLKQALLPLNLFSTAYKNTPVGNEADGNSVTVPVYEYTQNDNDVKNRNPGDDYTTLVSDTTTAARKIVIDKERVVGISFTNEEARTQVAFDPAQHGMIKGHQLAHKVLREIFAVARYGRFNSRTIDPVSSSAFDENDVADLAQICMEDYWGQLPAPALVLNPAYHFALVKQPALIDASQAGDNAALRKALIKDIMGFEEVGTPALPLNNGTAAAFTAVAATDLCTLVGHGFLTGDQVLLTTTNTLPAGLTTATYYYVIRVSDDTFKLAASVADALAGNAVDITDTGTGVHSIAIASNIVGFAGHKSAIITGFRPIIPTDGIRQKLIDFELVEDDESGLTLEYRHIADEKTGKEFQLIGCRFGFEYGLASTIKLISSPAA